jgi:hypothetical protein
MKYWIALLGGFGLAILVHQILSTTTPGVVIDAAMPGLIAHLLITGGHGGTVTEERFGSVLEIAVNTMFYAALLWAVPVLFHKLCSPKSST